MFNDFITKLLFQMMKTGWNLFNNSCSHFILPFFLMWMVHFCIIMTNRFYIHICDLFPLCTYLYRALLLWFFHESIKCGVEIYAQNNVNHNYQLMAVSTLFFSSKPKWSTLNDFNMLRIKKSERVKRANAHRRKADMWIEATVCDEYWICANVN